MLEILLGRNVYILEQVSIGILERNVFVKVFSQIVTVLAVFSWTKWQLDIRFTLETALYFVTQSF